MAREAAHITQEELANAVGCTAKHIGAIERGDKTPKLDTFIIITNTIGLSADLLLQDVLSSPIDTMAGEVAAAMSPLSMKMKRRILMALHVFAEGEE